MIEVLKRSATLVAVCTSCGALYGCLITNFLANQVGGLTTVTATVTLTGPAPCTVDTTAVTTNCRPIIQVGSPPLGQTYQIDITLLDYAAPLTLYDPLIVQVPASMSNFAGTIGSGPPPIAQSYSAHGTNGEKSRIYADQYFAPNYGPQPLGVGPTRVMLIVPCAPALLPPVKLKAKFSALLRKKMKSNDFLDLPRATV